MLISTRRIQPALIRDTGALSNYRNLPLADTEPAGHGVGRSRGGLTTKVHTAVDGKGRPLAVVVTGGQRNDGAMLATVLDEIVVPRIGKGRARSRPEAVIADRAYTSGVTRRPLRRRKIIAVIPQKRDEIAARQHRGSAGGRPPAFNETPLQEAQSRRAIIRPTSNNGGLWPRATTSSPSPTALPLSLSACITWARHLGDML